MKWQPFLHQDTAYDLSHLHPTSLTYEQPAKEDKPALTYTVEVRFSLHCFTRGIGDGEHPDPALLYSDSRETRIFDFRRYELSKQLPGIVQNLSRRKCYNTGKGNFFTVVVIGAQGQPIDYDIFFEASRSTRKGLVLFVQSAYARDAQHGSRPRAKPIGFYVILYNTLNNKPIRMPQ
jgi:hypothetical protein